MWMSDHGDGAALAQRPRKLLDHVRDVIRTKHYSLRAEEAYVTWIKRYVFFHNMCHPRSPTARDVEIFLTHLAVDQHVAASTQNPALSAILFLYRDLLRHTLPNQCCQGRAPASSADRPVDVAKKAQISFMAAFASGKSGERAG